MGCDVACEAPQVARSSDWPDDSPYVRLHIDSARAAHERGHLGSAEHHLRAALAMLGSRIGILVLAVAICLGGCSDAAIHAQDAGADVGPDTGPAPVVESGRCFERAGVDNGIETLEECAPLCRTCALLPSGAPLVDCTLGPFDAAILCVLRCADCP